MSEWQLIETAPKKGKIDLWCDGIRFTGCYWDHICGEYRTSGTAGVLQRIKNATHWMPIPDPPKQKAPARTTGE